MNKKQVDSESHDWYIIDERIIALEERSQIRIAQNVPMRKTEGKQGQVRISLENYLAVLLIEFSQGRVKKMRERH